MPKRYDTRLINDRGEANLARRVERLRTAKEWSYETLAKAMTDAGCEISKAAVYSIERGTPPRRITVNELLALAEVFELEVVDLLTPVDVVDKLRAQELIQSLQRNQRNVFTLASDVFDVFRELAPLTEQDPDLLAYVKGHYSASPTGLSPEELARWAAGLLGERRRVDDALHWDVAIGRVLAAAADFHAALLSAASLVAAGERFGLSDEGKAQLQAELDEQMRLEKHRGQ